MAPSMMQGFAACPIYILFSAVSSCFPESSRLQSRPHLVSTAKAKLETASRLNDKNSIRVA